MTPLNVLIVDDSSVMRKMIAKTLGFCCIPVDSIHEAGNGLEGLQVLQSTAINLVLVDIHMPDMTGLELFEKIRQNPKLARLPIIFVSSDSSASRIGGLLERGAGFVHKPITPEGLRESIQSTLTSAQGGIL